MLKKALLDLKTEVIKRTINQNRTLRSFNIMLKEKYGNESIVGCELGVSTGINAKELLDDLNIKKLYLVDCYLPYKEIGNFGNIIANGYQYERALKRLKRYKGKIEFIIEKSVDAYKFIPDNLDFIYIDSDHTYDTTKKEIEIYYPKTKDNGVFGGHDFASPYFGLIDAVNEMRKKIGCKLNGYNLDWWYEFKEHKTK